MSYDICLKDQITGETLELDEAHHMRGGTYAVGGMRSAHLNVTYNYAGHYSRVFESLPVPRDAAPAWMHEHPALKPVRGVRTIYGLTGVESISLLDKAIAALGNDVSQDYWAPTEGNAKRALIQLRALAAMRPDGVWSGD